MLHTTRGIPDHSRGHLIHDSDDMPENICGFETVTFDEPNNQNMPTTIPILPLFFK